MKKVLCFLLLLVSYVSIAQTKNVKFDAEMRAQTPSMGLTELNVTTSMATVAASTAPAINYRGSTWVRVAGAVTSSTPGYPGYVLPALGNFHYERDRQGMGINALEMGVKDDSTFNSTAGWVKARAYAKLVGTYTFVPHMSQPQLLDPQMLTDDELIYCDDVKIKRTTTRGYAFWGNVKNTVLSGVNIDCNASQFEGGYYISGVNNKFLNFEVRNGDQTSVVVAGAVFNGNGSFTETRDNLVKNGRILYQKRYHEGGGKSPAIAGDRAKNTTFEDVTCIDNGRNISLDDFDSDFADGTRWIRCHVKNTVYREGAAFYAEGEQIGEHQVYLIDCSASNKRLGAAASENARMNIRGLDARLCRNAINGLNNNYEMIVDNVRAIKCGAGLELIDTEGVYTFSGPATLINCRADSSLARWDAVNYSAVKGAGTLRFKGGEYKNIMAAYENGGNERVFITDATVGQIRWQCSGVPTRRVYIKGGDIKSISGAKIWDAVVDGVTMIGTGTASGTAIDIQHPDYINTKIINSRFENYVKVYERATIFGTGNSWYGITTPPVQP